MCGLYVLAIIRQDGDSDFIPRKEIKINDSNDLMEVRRGCERAMWHTSLVYLYMFGKDTNPDVMMHHIYNGLCIRKGLDRFVNDAIILRQHLFDIEEKSRQFHAKGSVQQISSDDGGTSVEEEGQGAKTKPPSSMNEQRGIKRKLGKNRPFPEGPIFDAVGNQIFDDSCNPIPTDLYGDTDAPRFLDMPDIILEENAKELLGEDGNAKDGEGLSRTLLRDGAQSGMEQLVKYVQDPAKYLDALALAGEYYGNLRQNDERMRRGFLFCVTIA